MAIEERDICICRKSNHKSKEKVNLLLISEDDKWHYTVIESLSRLLASRNSKHKGKQHFCTNCLQGFNSEASRDKYYEFCNDNETVRIEMPKKGSFVKFNDGQNQFKVPFTIYADFELILKPTKDEPEPEGSFTKIVNQHIHSGFCFYSKFTYGDVKNPLTIYRGKDCMSKFCELVKKEAKRLYNMFPEKLMKPLTSAEKKEYAKSKTCHICLKPFKSDNPKVRDHCHYTGKYRGPAHRICNLNFKIPPYIPVIFHNLSGYDAHLFIKELGKETNEFGVIAKNREDYIIFSVGVTVDKYVDKDGMVRD